MSWNLTLHDDTLVELFLFTEEYVSGRRTHEEPDIPQPQPVYAIEPSPSAKYQPARIDAYDAIKLAAMWMKRNYDQGHKPMFFNPGEFVLLRLHRGYNLPGLKQNHKLQQQFAGPYQVLERVGRLAYRIQLPPTLRIHPVVSVAHLEPAPAPDKDPFERNFGLVNPHERIPESILQKRILKRTHGSEEVEYLVRFQGLSAEHDQWIKSRKLTLPFIDGFEKNLQEGIAEQ